MVAQTRDRWFSRFAEVLLRRPAWVLTAFALVCVAAGAFALPGLGVSTSRTGLVSDDDPQQRRMNAFSERFGRPDSPTFLVSGGTASQRRETIDRLELALAEVPEVSNRILGRIAPKDVGPILLLQKPEVLVQFQATLGAGPQLAVVIEGGLVSWLRLLHAQLVAGLQGAEGPGDAATPDEAQMLEGLDQLATAARALNDYLGGRDAVARLAGNQPAAQRGVDDHGYLVTADGEHHLIALFPDLESDEGRVLEPFVLQLRAVRDTVMAGAPAEVTADLTGLPALSVDELTIVRNGLQSSSLATTLGIFGLCLALFRSLRQTIVALVPLLPGVVLTLVAVRILYDDLNLITSSFVAVLLGLGIDFSVHFIARRNEQVRAGVDERNAIKDALRHTGPGILTGAVITAAAFLTTATTEFTAYAELGVITAIGLFVIVIATFVLLPTLLAIGRAGATNAPPEPPGLRGVLFVVKRFRGTLLVIAATTGVAGAVALPAIEFNPRYFDFLPQDTESARALRSLEYDALASPVFASVTAASVEEARAKANSLREYPSVAGVLSASDLLPPLREPRLAALRGAFAGMGRDPDFVVLAATELRVPELLGPIEEVADALDEIRFALTSTAFPTAPAESAKQAFLELGATLRGLDAAGLARLSALHRELAGVLAPAWTTARAVAQRGGYLASDLPPLFARRFVSKDGSALAVHVVPAGDFWDVDVATKFSADVRAVDPDAVGLALVHVEHGEMILRGFRRAALVAAGVIIIILLIDFRSLADAIFALIPTALGWSWMVGLMVLFGLRFDVANIVALPLVLGIGIAFGVHLMHRVREGRIDGQLPGIEDVVRGTGGAIAVAALTTMVGFGGLMISDYGGMKSLALVMVMGIGASLVATLLVLPALLLFARRAQDSPS